MEKQDRPPPLDGVAVVELCRYISGPYATRLLADLGADVIKVEDPSTGGDPPRWMAGGQRPYSPQFASWNRGKRSICLDLKSREGLLAMRAMLAQADVFVDNMRPGVLDRLGLGDGDLQAVNPTLVHCSLTGFGPAGPRSHDPSYDSIISAVSGLYSEMEGGGMISPGGPSWSDLITGMFGSHAILAALRARDRDGEGQRVHVSMLNAVMDLMNDAVTTTIETGQPSSHGGRQRRQGIVTAVAADGLPLVVQFGERTPAWNAFTTALGRPELFDDPRFVDYSSRVEHHSDLLDVVRPVFMQKSRDHWLQLFAGVDLACSPINDLAAALQDPQVVAAGLLEDDSGPDSVPSMRPPAQIVPAAVGQLRPPPDLGEHTSQILSGLGLAVEDQRAIRATADQAARPVRKLT